MNLYDTITQSDLNEVIDLLLGNYHREIGLSIDSPINDYCTLSFDLSEGVDAGEEIIFNNGDDLIVNIDDVRLAEMGYAIRFYYYQLDKADYTGTLQYGDLKELLVDLDSSTVTVSFTDDQIYLQKGFDLILMNAGHRLILSADKSIALPDEDVVLTAYYSEDTVPVEGVEISFYNGETLLDTVETDSDGEAVLTLSDLDIGTYSFNCVYNGIYSNNVGVTIISNNVIELEFTGTSFTTYASQSNPFTYNGRMFVDWGDDSELFEYTGGVLAHNYNSSGNYTIRINGDITSLGRYCFANCTGLTSITIPSSVTSLGNGCFDNCTGLTSITLPSSVTSLGNGCFTRCTGLTSVTLPNTITSLGNSCFDNCTGLTSISIPNSVTTIEGFCFDNCTSLAHIYFNWTSTDILSYNINWIANTYSGLKFNIPSNTTSLYTAKGYPSDKLVEDTT